MTAQVSEKIIYEGIQLALLAEPDIPTEHPRLSVVSEEEAAKDNEHFNSTACYRGYIGEWAVRKGVLYLVALKGIYRLLPGPDIPATWYTGTLRMPTSQMVEYVHSGYETRFYSEFFAEVEFGVVVRTRNEFNNPYQLFLDELVRRFDFKKDRLSDAAWTAINSRTLQGYGTKRIAKLLPNLDVQITIGATNRGKELNLNHQIYEMARKFGFEVRDEKSTSGSRKNSGIYPTIAAAQDMGAAFKLLELIEIIA